jgi:tellurite resistance protein TerC
MTARQISYLTFIVVLLIGVILDLGFLSKKSTPITIRKALLQTLFWVFTALSFFGFLWYENGHKTAFEYLSAYLMEWSLSIDNIFVFILIFTYFGLKEEYYGRILLIGILLAIFLRIIFISAGIVLIAKFDWLLYVFGAILVYTGTAMFFSKKDQEVNIEKNRVYRFLKKILPLTSEEAGGNFTLVIDHKRYYTRTFVVVILLATTDIVFAVDSIPAVFGITQDNEVIYTSNIFAVLGLRSLFFLLKGAVNKFSHLQHGIAFVLIFIGLKMLVEFFGIHISVFVSLVVILVSIAIAILYSIFIAPGKNKH